MPGPGGHNGRVSERYTIEEADTLIPEVAERMARLGALQREAAEYLARARRRARRNGHRGGLDPEVTEEMRQVLEWFEERHLEVKGVSPPWWTSRPLQGEGYVALLTEGEERIGWYQLSRHRLRGQEAGGELEG